LTFNSISLIIQHQQSSNEGIVPELQKERKGPRQRLIFSLQWIVLGISLVLTGCANPTPILYPSPSSETVSPQTSHALTILLTPVDTSSFVSPARAQYGLDVSAYFTAFELQLINHSDHAVNFDSQQIYLIDAHGKSHPSLSEEEGIEYYRYGDAGPGGAVVLLSKPITLMRAEIQQIRRLHIRSATLLPGETHRGVVLFKKISGDQCRNIHVRIQGITFAETDSSRDVNIAFTCVNQER
jgi:hypothetical protein